MATENHITVSECQCKDCLRGPDQCWHITAHPDLSCFLPYASTPSNITDEEVEKAAPLNRGSFASYYTLPPLASELQDLISFLNCNAQLGEIGRAWYRYSRCPHSDRIRDLNKIIFYAKAEITRITKYEGK